MRSTDHAKGGTGTETCHDMKLTEVYTCGYCCLELRVVKARSRARAGEGESGCEVRGGLRCYGGGLE